MAGADCSWDRARPGDEALLESFVVPRESEAAFLSARLREAGIPPRSRAKKEALFVLRGPGGEGARGILLVRAPGSAYAILDPAARPSNDSALARAVLGMREPPHSLIGTEAAVAFMKALLGSAPRAERAYILMALRSAPSAVPPPAGFAARLATEEDLDSLLPLQEAYEKEEVLLEGDLFDPDACRSHLRSILRREIAYILEDGKGRAVAKANTNARGFGWDQIGGVFTRKEERGRGLAGVLCAALARDIIAGGRNACLFVKRDNAPAIRVYEKLGFAPFGGFRISYLR